MIDSKSIRVGTGSAHSERTSFCGQGCGLGGDNLRGVTNRAVASGPPDTDVVVLVSQVDVRVDIGLQIGGGTRIPVKSSEAP